MRKPVVVASTLAALFFIALLQFHSSRQGAVSVGTAKSGTFSIWPWKSRSEPSATGQRPNAGTQVTPESQAGPYNQESTGRAETGAARIDPDRYLLDSRVEDAMERHRKRHRDREVESLKKSIKNDQKILNQIEASGTGAANYEIISTNLRHRRQRLRVLLEEIKSESAAASDHD